MEKSPKIFTLSNGLHVVHMYNTSKVAYCGLTINTGTRDELDNEHGMAHFLEHTLFKGTTKRKVYHINNRLESLGGELNAFTTKEETVIHATTLKSDMEKAIELIADIAFNSVFPEKEIEKEKTVIYDEIDSYRDNPSELILDQFEDLLFENSSLGHNILGTKSSIKKFNSLNIKKFIHRTYNTNEMVFASIGQTSLNKIERWCEMYLSNQTSNLRTFTRQIPSEYKQFEKRINKSTFQTHCILGNRAYEINNKKRFAFSLLMNILGGPASNSVLNTVLREKNGLVYNIEANYTPYSDTGAASIYFGTAKQNFEKSYDLVICELKKICNKPLSSLQLHKSKKQLIGQLTIAYESNEQQMLSMGKSLIMFNSYETMEDTVKQIQEVTVKDILETANEILYPQKLSTLVYL